MDRNVTMQVMFPRLSTDYAGAAWNDADGWTALGTNALFIQQNIDLAGYAQQKMTTAVFETMMQDPGLYLSEIGGGGASGAGNRLMVTEIISSVPFTDNDLQQVSTDLPARAPGMLGTNQDFEQIIYGNTRLYVQNSTLGLPGYFQLIESSGFGSKEPTAADTLFGYKIVQLVGSNPGDTLQIPASRIGLSGRAFAEEDLPYIMRLKRSYELQQDA